MTQISPHVSAAVNAASSAATFLFASIATALAGFLDAVGYNQLDHLYVSFMSGNSTHFGMALAEGNMLQVAGAGLLIAVFVAGTSVGTLILDAASRSLASILAAEMVLCSVAIGLAWTGFSEAALSLAALMMGMQNVLHQNVHGTDAGKGFITGALFGLGQSLARALNGRGGLMKGGVYVSTWIFFIIGVCGGSLCVTELGVVISLVITLVGLSLLASMSLGTAVRPVQSG